MIMIFAYGSNLDVAQMERRCPSARVRAEARLANHRLAFAGYSHGWRGAVATVAPAKGRIVRGIVYAISKEDLMRLDGFEGAPRSYERRVYPVRLGTGERAMVAVYVQPTPVEEDVPSGRYYETIARAYKAWGFDPAVVDRALVAACRARAAAAAQEVRLEALAEADARRRHEEAERRALIARRFGEVPGAGLRLSEPQQLLLDATQKAIPMSGVDPWGDSETPKKARMSRLAHG